MFQVTWKEEFDDHFANAGTPQEFRDTILQAELGLYVLDIIFGEVNTQKTIGTIWAIMTNLPLPNERHLHQQTDISKMITMARIFLRFTGRRRWEDLFLQYLQIDARWRAYVIETDDGDILNSTFKRSSLHVDRLERFHDILFNRDLSFDSRTVKYAESGKHYFLAPLKNDNFNRVYIDIPESALHSENSHNLVTTNKLKRADVPPNIEISFDELTQIANELDTYEEQTHYKDGRSNWRSRLKSVQYRVVENNQLSGIKRNDFRVVDMTHIAGMVGSGKSTIMQLLAVALARKGQRTTIVVQDTITALDMANYLNKVAAKGEIIASAITGRSTKANHLARLYQVGANAYGENAHDGYRWLNQACPIQGMASITDLSEPVPFGREPCSALFEASSDERRLCPLFSVCPSQQLYRDMFDAMIWITTPGAMGAGSLPGQVEERSIKLGEVIYEQSHLVILDEVDTIQQWFDAVYAPQLPLIGSPNAFFDVADVDVAEKWSQQQISGNTVSWSHAVRTAANMARRVTESIQNDIEGEFTSYIDRGFFTPYRIFEDIKETLISDLAQVYELDKENKAIMRLRNNFSHWITQMQRTNLSQLPLFVFETQPAEQLSIILKEVIREGANSATSAIVDGCKAWLMSVIRTEFTDTDKDEITEIIEKLGKSLDFALSTEALDQNMRIVFSRWYDAPEDIPDRVRQYFNQRVPRHLIGFIPTPATGRLFGFRYQQHGGTSQITAIEYANIGRWYIMNFHRLRSSLDGIRGPHVLALSGTSWMPDASGLHFDVGPHAVLEPSQRSTEAIGQSTFEFLPMQQETHQGKSPIFVSGTGDYRLDNLRNLTTYLIPYFAKELKKLAELGSKNENLWQDRQRLLLFVNSYDQVKAVTRKIFDVDPNLGQQVLGLKRGSELDGSDIWEFPREDIEQAGRIRDKKILVVPIFAVGRAYNILNTSGKAAFGSAYFLTRPMPQPFDLDSIVNSSNRLSLDLCKQTEASNLFEEMKFVRHEALIEWERKTAYSRSYQNLSDNDRRQLTATTAVLLIQAMGRLLRGGVPFNAYFVDAAWAPEKARGNNSDTVETSLLLSISQLLTTYVSKSDIGKTLYQTLSIRMQEIFS